MNDFLKKTLRIPLDYLITTAIYFIALLPFMTLLGENTNKWLWLYSLVMFLLLFNFLFIDYSRFGAKDAKAVTAATAGSVGTSGTRGVACKKLQPAAFRGLLFGLIGILPLILIGLTYFLINTETEGVKEVIDYAYKKVLFGPVYFIAHFLGGTAASFTAAASSISLVTMLGYLFGYCGIRFPGKNYKAGDDYKAKRANSASPWNPSYNKKEKK